MFILLVRAVLAVHILVRVVVVLVAVLVLHFVPVVVLVCSCCRCLSMTCRNCGGSERNNVWVVSNELPPTAAAPSKMVPNPVVSSFDPNNNASP